MDFNLKTEIAKLEESNRRDLNIIAFYIQEKGIKVENPDQLGVIIRRNLRVAKDLKVFDDARIVTAKEIAKKKFEDLWTLETILKIIINNHG